MNVVSFVDRDMVMRYFGGGIGHLKNALPLQVPRFDPIDPSSEEMAVEEDDNEPSRDVVTNSGELDQLELGEDDEDDDDDECGDQTDDDDDSEEGEDDYDGYA